MHTIGISIMYIPSFIILIFNINKQILRIPILYSIFPFITSYIIEFIADMDILLRDKLIISLFCYENLLIIAWFSPWIQELLDILYQIL